MAAKNIEKALRDVPTKTLVQIIKKRNAEARELYGRFAVQKRIVVCPMCGEEMGVRELYTHMLKYTEGTGYPQSLIQKRFPIGAQVVSSTKQKLSGVVVGYKKRRHRFGYLLMIKAKGMLRWSQRPSISKLFHPDWWELA